VTLTYRVRADADDTTLEQILDAARKLSPVFDTVSRPVEVTARLGARPREEAA
jgi:hypothetical protein